MGAPTSAKRRRGVRRNDDRRLRRLIDRYTQVFHVSQVITSELDFDRLFNIIIEQITNIIEAERCSIFLIDDQGDELRAFVSSDLKPDEFRIPKNHGIAGWVFTRKAPVIINDAYNDPRFFSGVDKQTGFLTRSILCVPLVGRNQQCIGTLQVLNKIEGSFSDTDLELLTYIASYVTIALENSLLYEKLKSADEVKEKVIHHLSHELKTPIAVLESSLKIIARQLHPPDTGSAHRAVDRARRSLQRLADMQRKVDDIMQHVECLDRCLLHTLLDQCVDTLETLAVEQLGEDRIADCLRRRIEDLFGATVQNPENIPLHRLVSTQVENMRPLFAHRRLALEVDLHPDAVVCIPTDPLQKVIHGLVKNAVENTPDGGRIHIAVNLSGNGPELTVSDTGIGIVEELQQKIFEGFYPTQDTSAYSTKKPFDFNAGGKGVDLLRMRIFSDRFDFNIKMSSERCGYIPLSGDVCPGAIDLCAYCRTKTDCYRSGGTTFTVTFDPRGGHQHG